MAIINIDNMEIKKLTLADLIADAAERNNREALEWLRTEANKMVDRKAKDGTVTQVHQSVNAFRTEYLTRFCGYSKKQTVQRTAAEKREKKMNDMFDAAFAQIK